MLCCSKTETYVWKNGLVVGLCNNHGLIEDAKSSIDCEESNLVPHPNKGLLKRLVSTIRPTQEGPKKTCGFSLYRNVHLQNETDSWKCTISISISAWKWSLRWLNNFIKIFKIPHECIVHSFHSIQAILIIHVRDMPLCAIIEIFFANMSGHGSKQTKHATRTWMKLRCYDM